MSVIISHPTGNEFSKAAALGFLHAGMLDTFYTSVSCMPGDFLYGLSNNKFLSKLKRRSFDVQLQNKIKTHPFKESGRLLSSGLKLKRLVKHETGIFSVDAVYQYLDKYVAKKIKENHTGASTVYCYEDGAYYTFQQAKRKQLKCIYDLPIGYWQVMQKIMLAEKELNPEWAVTIGSIKDSQKKLLRKNDEISFADKIIVASKFTQNTLKEFPGDLPEVRVIPYGFPPVMEKKYRLIRNNSKLKLLFVGGLSQRKGLSYLFKAVDSFGEHISLTVIGQGEQKLCKPLMNNLSKHKWVPTMPHNEILEAMSEHDVLVLPSLFEGFGLVITEAMACGTPVITTERTAGPDIIEHNKNGWIAEAGSSEAIEKILETILLHPEIIEHTGKEALNTARQRSWHDYGNDLADAVKLSDEKISF